MDYMLQIQGSKYVCSIPDGLRELMMDITREVLKSEPIEVYSFIADYLEALLITREHARIAARVVTSLADASATIGELLMRTGMTREQAEDAARVVQIAFKEHTDARQKGSQEKLKEFEILQRIIQMTKVKPAEAVKAAVVIQSAFREYMERQMLEDKICKETGVNWQKAARHTMELYAKTKPTETQKQQAATLIQALYRGYYHRKNIAEIRRKEEEQKRKEKEEAEFKQWVDENVDEVEDAAELIQQKFREWIRVPSSYKEEGEEEEEEKKEPVFKISVSDPELNAAATLIQRNFRQYVAEREAEELAEESVYEEYVGDEQVSYPTTLVDEEEFEEIVPSEEGSEESNIYNLETQIDQEQIQTDDGKVDEKEDVQVNEYAELEGEEEEEDEN